jgi:cullin 3
MFRLLSFSSQALDEMRSQLALYIRERGREIQQSLLPATSVMAAAAKPWAATGPLAVRWMGEICTLQAYSDQLLVQSLGGDGRFQTGITEAFQTIVNSTAKSPELLALFIDENFNRRSRNSEQQVDLAVQQAINVFRYLNDKDVFERHYKQHLAKRLLGGKSISEETERLFITKLKVFHH